MNCLPGAGWAPVRTDVIPLDVGGHTETVNRLIVEKGIDRLLVLYWYQTASRITASEYARKFNLITDALSSGRTDVALVRVIGSIDPRDPDGEAHALALTRPFAERALPAVQQQLFE
jgi:EpsI family protein